MKRQISSEICLFSYIHLTASYIGYTNYIYSASDTELRPVYDAEIISLIPQVSRSLSQRENITPRKSGVLLCGTTFSFTF